MDLTQYGSIGSIVGGVLATITLLSMMHPKVRLVVVRVWGMFKTAYSMEKQLIDINGTLKVIYGELRPNEGKSLRDTVERVDRRCMHIEQRHRAGIEISAYAAFEADKDGKVIYVNRSFCSMVARTPEELYGSGWYNILHDGDRSLISVYWEQCVIENREFEREYRIINNSTQVVSWVEMKAYRLVNDENGTIGWSGVLYYRDEWNDRKRRAGDEQ